MKKNIGALILSLLLVFGASSANATPFTIDLGAINTALGTNLVNQIGPTQYTTIEVDTTISVETEGTNYSTINQYFGADGILNDGDNYDEFGYLGILSFTDASNSTQSVNMFDATTGQIYKLFIEFTDLTGDISNYDNAGIDGIDDGDTTLATIGAIANDTYDINFNATNGGNVKIFLENQTTNVQTTLATLDVVRGEGSSPQLVNNSAEGQFDLSLDFTTYDNVASDVFSLTGTGLTFGDWEALYGNSIFMDTINLGATVQGDLVPFAAGDTIPPGIVADFDGVTVKAENDGQMSVNVVPEPTTMFLLGSGLLFLAGVCRKKRS